jgi:hypothetical protein
MTVLEPIRPTIATWVLALGGTGLVVGYVAPLVLAPEANTGPLIGIFITGPLGALAGLILGVAFRFAPVLNAVRRRACGLAAAIVCAATLYRSLPDPAVHGHVIDARVESCARPAAILPAAVAEWEQAVARVTWAAPAANWRATAIRNVERDPGVVLQMRIQRQSAILRHRAPWDRNRMTADPWVAADELKPYYAIDEGGSCAPYLARGSALYWPAVDADLDPTKPADPWPPADTLSFLQLQTLEPVPPEYARLLPQSVEAR